MNNNGNQSSQQQCEYKSIVHVYYFAMRVCVYIVYCNAPTLITSPPPTLLYVIYTQLNITALGEVKEHVNLQQKHEEKKLKKYRQGGPRMRYVN